jgi:sulfur-oxidizing protein SoxX
LAALAAFAFLVAGCASGPTVAELDALTDRIVKASFRTQGIANVERVTATDETNRACSEADASGLRLDEKTAKAFEEANF